MSNAPRLDRLTENAIDFLNRAISEFKQRPKYSVINFYTAVELFLKARLLHEHWSLVIAKNPDRQKFESGDFISVTFEEACDRLSKIVQSGVPDRARQNFDAIRKHRNKMVHFFHDVNYTSTASVNTIAREQLRAWYDLNKLLTEQWKDVFEHYTPDFREIERKLAGHREYLKAKFADLVSYIDAQKLRGVQFRLCRSCKFPAAQVAQRLGDLNESKCLVCDLTDIWFKYQCSACDQLSDLHDGGAFLCEHCGHEDNEAAIAKRIGKYDFLDVRVLANCSHCDSRYTVVDYEGVHFCVTCFRYTDTVELCGWCSEYNNGNMETSAFEGCSACGGHPEFERWRDDERDDEL